MHFPSSETIELVLRNHQHEVQRWPLVDTTIPLNVDPRRRDAVAPRARSRKERDIIDLLLREPLVNAEEIRLFFKLSRQRAKLLVAEARHQRRTGKAAPLRTAAAGRYPHVRG